MQFRLTQLCLFVITGMLFTACAPQYSGKVSPKVINGEIDLTGWDFAKDGPVKLDGDWLFAWEKFVEPASWDQLKEQMEHTAQVPAYWRDLENPGKPGVKLPPTGYATYAVKVSGLNSSQQLAYLLAGQNLAFEATALTMAGQVRSTQYAGRPSKVKELEIPTRYSPLSLANIEQETVLLLYQSNHHSIYGGQWQSITLALRNYVSWKINQGLIMQVIMAGVLLIIGLYHLILFLQRSKDRQALYFGLCCMAVFFRIYSMGIGHRLLLEESILSTEWLKSLEYLTMPLMVMLFSAFVYSLFPTRALKLITWTLAIPVVPLVLLAVSTKQVVFGKYLTLYQLHILAASMIIFFLGFQAIKGNRLALLLLVAPVIAMTGIINDILYANDVIRTGHVGPYTMLTFILIQAGIISYKNAKAYKTAEHLTEKLSAEVDLQTTRHIRIQDLTKEIQNSASLDDFYRALKMTLRSIYKIKNFCLLMVNQDDKSLEIFDLSTAKKLAERDPFKKRKIDMTHPGSLHGKVLQKKKSYVFKRVKSSGQLEENEQSIIQKFNMSALYLLPLVVADQVFAMFNIFDTKDDELSYVANLTPYEREELEQLSSLISAGLYQHLQKEKAEKAQAQLEKQTKKLNQIQYLSQQIQNNSDLDTMIKNLNYVLDQEFKIPGYNFFLLNQDKNQLEVFKLEFNYNLPKSVNAEVYRTPLDLSHPKSLHGAIVRKGKPYFLSRLLDVENSPDEMKYRELTGMKSLFFLPLKVDGEVFAALSMVDTKFQEKDRIKFLTREERTELVQLSEFVSSALYQALQKAEIEKAQAAASRAKNEAAISQLAAHLAHEVNNPLNYIATGKTMQSDSFDKYHDMILGVLTGEDEDSLAFKEELEKLQNKFKLGLEQTGEGQARIAKVIAEIRAITGVDGLNFSNFDLVPIINEELIYSLQRNQIKSGELSVRVTGTNEPLMVFSNPHILARSIRTVVSNCIHFARLHRGNEGELYIDCKIDDNTLLIEIGNNSDSIKSKQIQDMMFNLEKSRSHGTEQIGMAMIKELLQKINCDLVLADHGRESGKVIFQLQVPLKS